MTTCNLCGGEADIRIPGPPAVVECRRCRLVSLEVFPGCAARTAGYQEEYYREGSGARFLSPFERMVVVSRWFRRRAILRRMPGPGALLDVGCGRGILLELFRKRGWRVMGTQLSRTAAEAANRSRGVTVLCGELPEFDLPMESFDVATFFHVLEHLPDPERYLRKTAELLRTDGLLVVEVPNFESPGFRYLGVRNFCFDYPNHLVFFSPPSLKALLERCGFKMEGVSHFSLEYSPFTTLQNLLNVLPGSPSRLYRALMGNEEGRLLRRSPLTWLHAVLAAALTIPAVVASLAGLFLPVGNTMRFYCRKQAPDHPVHHRPRMNPKRSAEIDRNLRRRLPENHPENLQGSTLCLELLFE